MTAIVGVGDGERAWLATDGRNSLGHAAVQDLTKTPRIKTFNDGHQLGLVIAGYAVLSRLIDVWSPPDLTGEPLDVLPAAAESLGSFLMEDEQAWRRVVNRDDAGAHDGQAIMAYRGQVASVDARFHACVTVENRVTGGCTGDAVLAAFMGLGGMSDDDPAQALREALAIAADIDVHVGPPFTVVEIV